MRDFFSSHIRNRNTRRAYMEAVRQFSAFCAQHGIEDLAQVEPVHVAAFVEDQLRQHSKPTVKQRLAALRMLFDWMVVGQILAVNPAHAVRGPKHTQRKGKTPVLNVDEARALIDAIDTTSLPGLRDRALTPVAQAQRVVVDIPAAFLDPGLLLLDLLQKTILALGDIPQLLFIGELFAPVLLPPTAVFHAGWSRGTACAAAYRRRVHG
jgi:hypothetical protein